MYTFRSRVRYSEVDSNGTMDLTSVINYFQDCSTFHSEDVNQGLSHLQKVNRIWLLNSWQIIIHRFASLGENITIGTWPYAFNGFYGYRNFIMKDANDEVLAVANSVWIYMDSLSYRPVRILPENLSGYETEPPYEMDYTARKIDVPLELIDFSPFPVVKSNIDSNNHVNNGQYIKMAEEYLPENFIITQMRAEYKMSAVLGDMITPKTCFSNNCCTVILSNTSNKPYAIMEFEGKNASN